jgi:hypothetical protein
MVDIPSKPAGEQELQAFGFDGRGQAWGVFTVACILDEGHEGPEQMADDCHGILLPVLTYRG